MFPTSFAQQRLWFLNQLVPGNAFYNVDSAVPCDTVIDILALERTLHEIVRRHERCARRFTRSTASRCRSIRRRPTCRWRLIDLIGAAGRRAPRQRRGMGRRRGATAVRLELRAAHPSDASAASPTPTTCCSLRCTTSSPTVGRCRCSSVELNAIYAALRPASRRPCRSCRCSTRISRCGSVNGSYGECCSPADVLDHEAGPAHDVCIGRDPPVQSYRGATLLFTFPRALHDALKALSPTRRHHAVHDHGGGVRGGTARLHRPGRHRHRVADRQPQPRRDRGT